MADNKSSEGKRNVETITVTADVKDALKGLKAVFHFKLSGISFKVIND